MLPKSKILILKFSQPKIFGGAEKNCLKIFAQLKEKGLRFLLLTNDRILWQKFNENKLSARKINLGLDLKKAKKQTGSFLLSVFLSFFWWPLLIIYRFKGYNKLFCFTLFEKIILTWPAKLLGYKIVWYEAFSLENFFAKGFLKNLYNMNSNFVKIIVISKFLQQQLIEQEIEAKKISVIYDAIDPQLYKKQEDIFEYMADSSLWPLKQFRYQLGFIGKLSEKKGLHILIKAVSIIKKEIPQIYLTIVGDGPVRETLEWLIKEYNVQENVKLVGYKENFLEWIWDFEVFVLPSLSEALGISAIEAMACDKPVIASDVGGLPEVIENKVSGLLVQPNNSQALADAIMKIYKEKDLAPEFIKNGRKVIEEKFNLEKMTDDFYKELVC